jgi:putative transcriptional regulator
MYNNFAMKPQDQKTGEMSARNAGGLVSAGSGGIRMRKKDFDKLVASIRQAGRIRRREIKPSRVTRFAPPDIRAIRRRLDQSQTEFARMIGVSVATLQNWEQGRRRPEGPARALLKVAAINPKAVAAALAS